MPAEQKFPTKVNSHFFFGPANLLLAVAQGKDIEIYSVSPKKLVTTLLAHDEPITAIDISPQGLIVSALQDRNAVVWTPNESFTEFKKLLVFLNINRAATCVRWSPNGDKFAVGLGASTVCVCYNDKNSDWWVLRQLKKQFSLLVLSVAWHPNNVLLACGGTDLRCQVVSAYIKAVDTKPAPSVWGSKFPFGQVCGVFSSVPGGWVHDVAFSDSGDLVGFVSNDLTLTVVYPVDGSFQPVCVNTNYGPFKVLEFIGEEAIIAAGHNCFPVLFLGSLQGWSELKSLDKKAATEKPKPVAVAEDDEMTGSSALSMFRQLDLKGRVQKGSLDLPTVHQNAITCLRFYDEGHILTSGIDGRVVVFPI